MSVQVGTIAYKQNEKYAKVFPLLIEETEEIKQATKNLLCIACDMFITELFYYCTNASVFCAEKIACKTKKF